MGHHGENKMILKEVELIKKGKHPKYVWRPRSIIWKK